jgi:hypothetical protein
VLYKTVQKIFVRLIGLRKRTEVYPLRLETRQLRQQCVVEHEVIKGGGTLNKVTGIPTTVGCDSRRAGVSSRHDLHEIDGQSEFGHELNRAGTSRILTHSRY